MTEKGFWQGAKAAIPTVFGYISIGMAFGIVAAKAGIPPLIVAFMSIVFYSGSGQFALCALLLTKASLPTIAMTVFLINLRHFLMNLHVTTIFSSASLLQQVFIGTLMTDESYGVLLNERIHQKDISPQWMYGNNLASYITWIGATTVGCVLGSMIPNPNGLGVDFALIAMFVTIFASQLEGMVRTVPLRNIAWILFSVLFAYLALSWKFSGSIAVLLATLLGCFVGVMIDGE